jgi:hypothetical protein
MSALYQFSAATKADEVAYAYQLSVKDKYVVVTGSSSETAPIVICS